MEKDLGNYRKVYIKKELLKDNVPAQPMELFQNWFSEVEQSDSSNEHNAMTISTIGKDGYPKNRIVLLKKFNSEGFIFYTNYNSEKGKAIELNPNVCLSFFWEGMEQQIIIKGSVEKIAKNISDDYFKSRPNGSKLGAWASNQSAVVVSEEELASNLKTFQNKFKNKEIPRPKHWGGYIIKPHSVEFWQGRPNRMHDRIRYELQGDYSWKIDRLAP